MEFGDTRDSRLYEAKFTCSAVSRGYFIRYCDHPNLADIRFEFLGFKKPFRTELPHFGFTPDKSNEKCQVLNVRGVK